MMTTEEFFAEAKRLNLRMLGTPEETRAALDAKDAEILRLRAALRRIDAAGQELRNSNERWGLTSRRIAAVREFSNAQAAASDWLEA